MNQLGDALDEEQFGQIIGDMKKTIQGKKEDFCKANYQLLQEAKTRLLALLTEIMMTEARFKIDQSLQECKRKTQYLNKERDHLEKQREAINTKKE